MPDLHLMGASATAEPISLAIFTFADLLESKGEQTYRSTHDVGTGPMGIQGVRSVVNAFGTLDSWGNTQLRRDCRECAQTVDLQAAPREPAPQPVAGRVSRTNQRQEEVAGMQAFDAVAPLVRPQLHALCAAGLLHQGRQLPRHAAILPQVDPPHVVAHDVFQLLWHAASGAHHDPSQVVAKDIVAAKVGGGPPGEGDGSLRGPDAPGDARRARRNYGRPHRSQLCLSTVTHCVRRLDGDKVQTCRLQATDVPAVCTGTMRTFPDEQTAQARSPGCGTCCGLLLFNCIHGLFLRCRRRTVIPPWQDIVL
mmetsp:Transcript_110507/g.323276  ORF Transcript_110507/g.323276 Transcript_110507/m.323276 type:complete len:309 (+) Transcript_110507:1227-2153(+)